ncbi:NAD(P)H-flavin reductase [Shewanella intestini]|uniref:NAD(P)H-flavin reductase n=1 Tax=Shewanella intestini TaxID=2017544 RepID=A0ABS5I2N5_9GAMM|nr:MULTISPECIES: NAD(P)H-flavin reductase [Shewanella]MBR9727610.1 NAD(P)H-flavin reductase [Shewanella intestini]MRG35240.1 NAD(P)H-flavin reductase [Shewanella sp. XMDDZSB0408]
MKNIRCKINQVTPFNEAVYQVSLTPDESIDFKAGQYLSVVMSDEDKRPFSIASAPNSQTIELHIGAAVSESYPMQVVERLKTAEHIDIIAPAGEAFLRPQHNRPRLLIAGGTGFSYIKSIIEDQIQRGQDIPTTFYWGCRTEQAMYYQQIARQWQQRHSWLTFVPVIEFADENWNGKTANLLEQIQTDYQDLSDYDIYIAGRFDMVGAAREVFREMAVNEDHLFGDAFAYIK